MKSLSCEECRESLALLIDTESASSQLNDAAQAQNIHVQTADVNVTAHLTTCAECSHEYSMLRATVGVLRSLPPVTPPSDLRERVRLQIAQEISQRVASAPVKTRRSFTFPRWVSLSFPSAAIAAGLLFLMVRQPETSFTPPVTESAQQDFASGSPSSTTTRSSVEKKARGEKSTAFAAKAPAAPKATPAVRKPNDAAKTSTRLPEIKVPRAPEASSHSTAKALERILPPAPATDSIPPRREKEDIVAPTLKNPRVARSQTASAPQSEPATSPGRGAKTVTSPSHRLYARLETRNEPSGINRKSPTPPSARANTMSEAPLAAPATAPQIFSSEPALSNSAISDNQNAEARSSVSGTAEATVAETATDDSETSSSGALSRPANSTDDAEAGSESLSSAASSQSVPQTFSATAPAVTSNAAASNNKAMSQPAAKTAPKSAISSVRPSPKSVYVVPRPKTATSEITSTRSEQKQLAFATLSLVLPRNAARARVILQWPGAAPQIVWSGKATRGQKLSLRVALPSTISLAGNKKRSAQVSVQEARPPVATQKANWTTIARENLAVGTR